MNESFKQKIKDFCSQNSKAVTMVATGATALLLALLGISVASCGSTVKALVQSPKDSATTTITITTNNPTQVSPETNVPIKTPSKL